MPFYLRGGVGPFWYSRRIGGSTRKSAPQNDASGILAIVALGVIVAVFMGVTWVLVNWWYIVLPGIAIIGICVVAFTWVDRAVQRENERERQRLAAERNSAADLEHQKLAQPHVAEVTQVRKGRS
jgi:Flp pilus assembly protein TadB